MGGQGLCHEAKRQTQDRNPKPLHLSTSLSLLILVGGRKTGLCNLGKGPGGGSRPPSLVICGALLGRAWEAGRRQGPSRQGWPAPHTRPPPRWARVLSARATLGPSVQDSGQASRPVPSLREKASEGTKK